MKKIQDPLDPFTDSDAKGYIMSVGIICSLGAFFYFYYYTNTTWWVVLIIAILMAPFLWLIYSHVVIGVVFLTLFLLGFLSHLLIGLSTTWSFELYDFKDCYIKTVEWLENSAIIVHGFLLLLVVAYVVSLGVLVIF
ncbi:MAG TPA: hypothetical protein VI603_10520 [Saprospiraceae bacterium]|nr:hypothetical protein [Saprospiraceae bacterium]